MSPKKSYIAIASIFLLIASAATISFSGAQISPVTSYCVTQTSIQNLPPTAAANCIPRYVGVPCDTATRSNCICTCPAGYSLGGNDVGVTQASLAGAVCGLCPAGSKYLPTFSGSSPGDGNPQEGRCISDPTCLTPTPSPSTCPTPTPTLSTVCDTGSTNHIVGSSYVCPAGFYETTSIIGPAGTSVATCCPVQGCKLISASTCAFSDRTYGSTVCCPSGYIWSGGAVSGVSTCCPSQTATAPVAQAPAAGGGECPAKPDLIIDKITIRDATSDLEVTFSEVGKKVKVEYDIKNIGTTYANLQYYPDPSSPIFENIKVSRLIKMDSNKIESKLDDDLPSIMTSGSSQLQSGQSISRSLEYTFLSAGTYCFEFNVDYYNIVDELNDANNRKSQCVKVYEKGQKSDLTVIDIAFRDPVSDLSVFSSEAGRKIKLAYNIKNIGIGDAKAGNLKILTAHKINNVLTYLKEDQKPNFILYQGQITLDYNFDVLPFVEGNYCAEISVDSDNDILELNENNNIASKCLTVTPVIRPDLILESMVFVDPITDEKINTATTSAEVGKKVKVEYVIKNIGKGNANLLTLTNHLADRGPGNIIAETKPDYSFASLNPLLPGLSHKGSIDFEFKTSGTHCIDLIIDKNNDVDESDERNNGLPGPCIRVEPALLAHWKFDEEGTTALYDSKGNYLGGLVTETSTSGVEYPLRVKGKFGKSLKFGGLADYGYVDSEVRPPDPNDFSVSLWVKLKELPGAEKSIMQIKGGLPGSNEVETAFIGVGPRSLLGVSWKSEDQIMNNIAFNYDAVSGFLNRWIHLAAVWRRDGQNTDVELYINGRLAAVKRSTLLAPNSNYVVIGGSSFLDKQLNGYVDDVRMYSGALSEKQIRKLYIPEKQCTADSHCESYERCNKRSKKCVEKSECKPLVFNGLFRRMNLLFMPNGIGWEEAEFQSTVKNLINYDGTGSLFGLFTIEPFKSNKQQFNIWTLVPGEDFFESIADDDAVRLKERAQELSTNCLGSGSVVVLSKKDEQSFSTDYGLGATAFVSLPNALVGPVLAHELGHSIFGLADEYLRKIPQEVPREPNCAADIEQAVNLWGDLVKKGQKPDGLYIPPDDVVIAYDINQAVYLWGKEVLELGPLKSRVNLPDGSVVILLKDGRVVILDRGTVGFYQGCSYVSGHFRPTANSIMNNHIDDKTFHEVNLKYMMDKIKRWFSIH